MQKPKKKFTLWQIIIPSSDTIKTECWKFDQRRTISLQYKPREHGIEVHTVPGKFKALI